MKRFIVDEMCSEVEISFCAVIISLVEVGRMAEVDCLFESILFRIL